VAAALVAVIAASSFAASAVPTIMADDAAAASAARTARALAAPGSPVAPEAGAGSSPTSAGAAPSSAVARAAAQPAATDASAAARPAASRPGAARSRTSTVPQGSTASKPLVQASPASSAAAAAVTAAPRVEADATAPTAGAATTAAASPAPTDQPAEQPVPSVEPSVAPSVEPSGTSSTAPTGVTGPGAASPSIPVAPTTAPAPVAVASPSSDVGPAAPVVPTPTATSPSQAPVVTPTPAAPATTTGRASALAGATLGSASYDVPSTAVVVATDGNDANPGTLAAPVATLARALAIAPSGGTVVVRGGSYHQGGLRIARTVTIEGYPGETVWFDGARPVSGFGFTGASWSLGGWSPVLDHSPTYKQGAPDGTAPGWQWVDAAHPMAAYPDMVWAGGRPLSQVAAGTAVTAGTFAVDTSAHVLTLGTDPSAGVEVSDLQQFAVVTAPGTTIRGIGIRRFADSVPMMGALVVYGAGTTVEQVAVDDNATQGLAIGTTGVTLRHVTANGNGLLGIQAAYADGLVLDGVRAEGNNSEHFNTAPVSGGVKVARSRGIVVRDSVVAGNAGMGLWFDESSYGITVVGSELSRNAGAGVDLELSDTAIVADDVVTDNADDGIKLHNTGHVQVWSNTVLRNRRDINVLQDSRSQFTLTDAGHDPRQALPDPTVPWLSQGITVRDNVLGGAAGNAVVGVEDLSHRWSAADLAISLDANAYSRTSATTPAWLVVWSAGSGNGGNPYVYGSLRAFASGAGQEAHGQELVAPVADPAAFTAVAPAPLPADVAAATGRTAAVGHLGAWS
jgi:hypothetical protein